MTKYFNIYIVFLFLIAFTSIDICSAQMYKVKDSIGDNNQAIKIFSLTQKNKKSSTISYVFAENHSDVSLGCEVWRVENSVKTPMNFFAIAAYTKDNSGRMNYNSILPYISICQAGKRTILSFECPLIVLYPERANEKICESKKLYGLIGENNIDIINY